MVQPCARQVARRGGYTVIRPTEAWQTATLSLTDPASFTVHPDYYVTARRVEGSAQ